LLYNFTAPRFGVELPYESDSEKSFHWDRGIRAARARRGSIDALSGFGSGPQIGAEMHQRVQARRRRENPSYRAEVLITRQFGSCSSSLRVNTRGLPDDRHQSKKA
jgi:hypothetical protein